MLQCPKRIPDGRRPKVIRGTGCTINIQSINSDSIMATSVQRHHKARIGDSDFDTLDAAKPLRMDKSEYSSGFLASSLKATSLQDAVWEYVFPIHWRILLFPLLLPLLHLLVLPLLPLLQLCASATTIHCNQPSFADNLPSSTTIHRN
jgi:hypothetical protein